MIDCFENKQLRSYMSQRSNKGYIAICSFSNKMGRNAIRVEFFCRVSFSRFLNWKAQKFQMESTRDDFFSNKVIGPTSAT